MGEERTQRRSVLLGGAGVDGGRDLEGGALTVWREAIAVARVEPIGVGVAFLEEPSPLIDASIGLGIDEVILRIEWARVMPRRGEIAEAAIDAYRSIASTLRAAGARVGVVLSDGTAPQWAGPDAWLMPGTAAIFGDYAAAIIDRLGASVDLVVTFEEPAAWAVAGWVIAAAPPFRTLGMADAIAALDAMGAAHVRAVACIGQSDHEIEGAIIGSRGALAAVEHSFFSGVPPRGRSAAFAMHRYGTGQMLRSRHELGIGSAPTFIGTFGRLPGPVRGPAAWLAPRPSDRASFDGEPVNGRSGSSVRCSSVVAHIDERGRRRVVDGSTRLRALEARVDTHVAKDAADRERSRLIVGEVVDRWRWGTFGSREGIFGVDRTRGNRGFELLETDASGFDAAGHLRSLLQR